MARKNVKRGGSCPLPPKAPLAPEPQALIGRVRDALLKRFEDELQRARERLGTDTRRTLDDLAAVCKAWPDLSGWPGGKRPDFVQIGSFDVGCHQGYGGWEMYLPFDALVPHNSGNQIRVSAYDDVTCAEVARTLSGLPNGEMRLEQAKYRYAILLYKVPEEPKEGGKS